MHNNKHFLNGNIVFEDKLLISPRDLGYSRGYSVFEFLRTYDGVPFLLKKHIDRLFNSAKQIHLKIPWSRQNIIKWVNDTLHANESDVDKVIRIIISGGNSYTFQPNSLPTIMIIIDDVLLPQNEFYEKGINAYLIEHQQYKPHAKTTNYIEAVASFQELNIREVDEIIYYINNSILEGYRSNIFVVMKDRIITPKSYVLSGITRGVLLEILDIDIPIVESTVSIDDIYKAEEIFITASAKEVMPVTQIDGKTIGTGVVGQYTKQAIAQLEKYIQSNIWQQS